MKAKNQHYYLASAKVLFSTPDGQPAISEHNCVLRQSEKNIKLAGLGKIQQLIQLIFRQTFEDPEIEVKHIFILNISYLGLMTEEEFNAEENKKPLPVSPMSPLLNPGDTSNNGEHHVLTTDNGRIN